MMRKPSRRKLATCSSFTSSKIVGWYSVLAKPASSARPSRLNEFVQVAYPPVADLSKQPLDEFLASVAEATPAPGGGSSAAVTAALAAALVEMAAGLRASDRAAEQAGTLRARALTLAQEEMSSYAPVLEARDERERSLALVAASEAPAQIAETAADVAELGVEVASSASAAVRGDALTGVTLAEAAASAAFHLVEINVGSGPVFERARAAELRAVRARSSATGRPPPTAHAPTPN
jgi:formiminotetrahydrofolate cyclodeaminase